MIRDLDEIDFITTDKEKQTVYLTIVDPLKWDEADHFDLLQKKINTYLKFIRTNQIYEDYPNALGKQITIEITAKYNFTDESKVFLEEVKALIIERYPQVSLSYRVV